MINKLTLKPNIEDLLGRAGVKGLNLYVKLNLKSVLSCKFLLELNFFMLFQDINYELILPGVISIRYICIQKSCFPFLLINLDQHFLCICTDYDLYFCLPMSSLHDIYPYCYVLSSQTILCGNSIKLVCFKHFFFTFLDLKCCEIYKFGRYWLETCHQILMKQLVSLWNIFFWSTIQTTISLIRFYPIAFPYIHKYYTYITLATYTTCSSSMFLVLFLIFCICMQVVYNANKLSKLVNEKKKLQNWLDYYQLKLSRNPSKRPSKKVMHYSFSLLSFSFHHAISHVN